MGIDKKEKEVIIQRVWKNDKANQKLVTIPKDSNISDDDFVFVQKIEFNKRGIYKTDIEEIMFNALTKENIDFVFQYPLRGKYGYIADFFISSYKLIIECDGEAWHNKKRDNTRDAVLKKQGYKILRFTGTQIKNELQSCISKVMEEIS
jgi:very-short-patch-repair endonuclease